MSKPAASSVVPWGAYEPKEDLAKVMSKAKAIRGGPERMRGCLLGEFRKSRGTERTKSVLGFF